MTRVAILGGGPAGVGAAWKLDDDVARKLISWAARLHETDHGEGDGVSIDSDWTRWHIGQSAP